MVVREGFFGNRRYDKIQSELGIAPNILTDRLSRLVARGVFHRRLYRQAPERYEYLLTDMGRDLYGPFVAMLAWGDRWLSKGKPPLAPAPHQMRTRFSCLGDLRRMPKADRRRRHAIQLELRSQGLMAPWGRDRSTCSWINAAFNASTSLNRMILPEPVRGISETMWVASGIL